MMGVDAIIVDPTSGTALDGAIEEAHNAGIPVISFNDGPVSSPYAYQILVDCVYNFDYITRWACEKMGGQRLSGADIGYAIELFDGLQIGIQFWHGDEEFLPRLRYLWDENARQYIRYETMYFAIGLLKRWILEYMENAPSD